jgi:citrate lyase subunit beta/citryl-CoA lyase
MHSELPPVLLRRELRQTDLMRSKLFVPGSRPELFAKALASEADGLSFDLEDAVTEARKPQARQALATCWPRASAQRKTLIVRVNAGHAALRRCGGGERAASDRLPKAESADGRRRQAIEL